MVGFAPLTTTSRIAVFGGTFDPIHRGHTQFAEALRDALGCTVLVIPCHVPPHRETPQASAQQRREMLTLALEGREGLVLDDRELRADRISYTVDTLQSLKQDLPDETLCLIIGSDAFAGFPDWHQPLTA